MMRWLKLLLFHTRLYNGTKTLGCSSSFCNRTSFFGLWSEYRGATEAFSKHAEKIKLIYRICDRYNPQIHLFENSDVEKYSDMMGNRSNYTVKSKEFDQWAKENEIYYYEAIVWTTGERPAIYFFSKADEALIRLKFNVRPAWWSRPPFTSYVIH